MSPSYSKETGLESDPVIIIRRSVRSLFWVLFLLGFAMVLIGALSITVAKIEHSWLASLLASDWLPIIPVAIAFEIVRRSSDCLYVFNPGALTAVSGRLEGYQRPTLQYEQIDAVDVRQSMLGRFLNYGTISISAHKSEENLKLTGVRAPLVVAKLLSELKGGERELIRIGQQAYLADRAYLPQKLAA